MTGTSRSPDFSIRRRYPAILLVAVWLPICGGCSALPRSESGEKTLLARHEAAPAEPGSELQAARAGSIQSVANVSGFSDPPQAAPPGQAATASAPAQQAMPQGAMLLPVPGGSPPWPIPGLSAEMKAFVCELDESPNLDPEIRYEILAWLSQTPQQYQSQLIRQYRALLAMRAAMPNGGGKSESGSPVVAANTPPESSGAEARREGQDNRRSQSAAASAGKAAGAVVAAAYQSPLEAKSESDLVEALASLIEQSKAKADRGGESHSPEAAGGSVAGSTREINWQNHVEAAIEAYQRQHPAEGGAVENPDNEARLRLLLLIANRREEACRPIPSLEPKMQDFWSQELFGLATLMSDDWIADRSNRLVESKRSLGEALARLGEAATLYVRNLAFVTEVQSYGSYTPFAEYEFSPGQKVLLYAEVDNYQSKETARGHHTSLRSSYEIFDSRRQKIADHQFETNEEYCRNRRRDFFTVCEFAIPEHLSPGKYELRLTVADLNGDKSGQSSIIFHVGQRAATK